MDGNRNIFNVDVTAGLKEKNSKRKFPSLIFFFRFLHVVLDPIIMNISHEYRRRSFDTRCWINYFQNLIGWGNAQLRNAIFICEIFIESAQLYFAH